MNFQSYVIVKPSNLSLFLILVTKRRWSFGWAEDDCDDNRNIALIRVLCSDPRLITILWWYGTVGTIFTKACRTYLYYFYGDILTRNRTHIWDTRYECWGPYWVLSNNSEQSTTVGEEMCYTFERFFILIDFLSTR